MSKFTLGQDGHSAHRLLPDGTIEERKFTSKAQARQFVEQHNNVVLAVKHKPPRIGQNRKRKPGNVRVPSTFTADQQKLIEQAKKIAKGL